MCGRPGGSAQRHVRAERPHCTYFAGTIGGAFAETVERAVRYVEAGADCIFVPGVVEEDAICRLAAAIPAPLNVVAGLANVVDAPTLFSLGVKRVSLGGSLERAALSMLERAGRELLDEGSLALNSKRLAQLKGLVESGTLSPIVWATYPMVQIVEAHLFVEAGHKRGGVAVSIE